MSQHFTLLANLSSYFQRRTRARISPAAWTLLSLAKSQKERSFILEWCCRGWGEIGSKSQSAGQQPIGKPTLPAPIRPPGGQNTSGKSMADLFKEPAKIEGLSGQTAPSSRQHTTSTSGQQADSSLYSGHDSEANGWGSSHGLEPVRFTLILHCSKSRLTGV